MDIHRFIVTKYSFRLEPEFIYYFFLTLLRFILITRLPFYNSSNMTHIYSSYLTYGYDYPYIILVNYLCYLELFWFAVSAEAGKR